jgi:hypothetical protein
MGQDLGVIAANFFQVISKEKQVAESSLVVGVDERQREWRMPHQRVGTEWVAEDVTKQVTLSSLLSIVV